MKPIISPWLIYFASRADNLTTFFGVIAGICSIIAMGAFFAGLAGYDEPFKFRKTISKSIIGCVVMTIITIMTPNTETIYTMAVVNEITPDNIQTIGKTGKEVVYSINSEQMYKDGYKFYLSKNGVWLTKKIPVKYLVKEI